MTQRLIVPIQALLGAKADQERRGHAVGRGPDGEEREPLALAHRLDQDGEEMSPLIADILAERQLQNAGYLPRG